MTTIIAGPLDQETFDREITESTTYDWRNDAAERRVALDWLDDHGIAWSPEHQGTSPVWDGEMFRLGAIETFNVFHEIAHWLVAPAYRRALPNFGEGPDAEGGGMWLDVEFTGNAHQDELLVSVLGIILWSTVSDTPWVCGPTEHSWVDYDFDYDLSLSTAIDRSTVTLQADFWSRYRMVSTHAQAWVTWLSDYAT